jgi:hypothetical protein
VDPSRTERFIVDTMDDAFSDKLISNLPNLNELFIETIFNQLRDEIRRAIEGADWIDSKFGAHINQRLSLVRLQIGIPTELLEKKELNRYYDEFIFKKYSFIDNVRYHWTFERKLMGDLLSTSFPENARIAAELFSAVKNPAKKKIKYLNDLNMVIISREILRKPYFHFKFPLPFNFARIGTELAAILFEAAYTIGEEYRENILFRDNQEYIRETDQIPEGYNLFGESFGCVER